MQYAALSSGHGRNASVVVAAAMLAVALAGCSSSVSRFDSVFGSSASHESADYSSTAALPPVLPEESVYSSGAPADAQYERASLPPPSYSPSPTRAAYSPGTAGRLRSPHANYSAPTPQADPAVWRGSQAQGPRIKVQPGDTLSSLSRRYGVSVEAIQAANNLPDGRLDVGQELVIPGAKLAIIPDCGHLSTIEQPDAVNAALSDWLTR